MRSLLRLALTGSVFTTASLLPAVALACGGFFCNQNQPVNQAAESIIFADNGDGTTTAVIQIQYQGPAESFSWLLPISSVPDSETDIAVASNLALQRLQMATNPRYTLMTRIEGTCREPGNGSSGGGSANGGIGLNPGDSPQDSTGGGVTVEASGIVGAFEWTVISLDEGLDEPADAAVEWLGMNAYDVPSGAPALLGPYLEDGLFLLALKLTKGADAGSIRPIVLTYEGTEASIPIKLTAVAANDDMGVLTWVLGEARAVPKNYLSLELNEARINWFNANSNYNAVVIEAADDAQGQGFVTEFAGSTESLASMVWTVPDENSWAAFSGGLYRSFGELFDTAWAQYSQYDGFWDATRAAVKLPEGVAFEDFKVCPNCYAEQITLTPTDYIAALERSVIEPMRLVQNLIDAHPTLTRMYTTMSADEMTLDPVFTFNADAPEVSNQHTAEQVIECSPQLFQWQAPWRIELANGDVVRGTGEDAQNLTWPSALADLPANSRIVQAGNSGSGKVMEDNAEPISEALTLYNESVPSTDPESSSGSSDGSSGCAIASPGGSWSTALIALGLAGALLRRRRRTL
jgi:MYXO-CTERM domain-containing protein